LERDSNIFNLKKKNISTTELLDNIKEKSHQELQTVLTQIKEERKLIQDKISNFNNNTTTTPTESTTESTPKISTPTPKYSKTESKPKILTRNEPTVTSKSNNNISKEMNFNKTGSPQVDSVNDRVNYVEEYLNIQAKEIDDFYGVIKKSQQEMQFCLYLVVILFIILIIVSL